MILIENKNKFSDPNKIVSIYDPCCGTGGMLTISKEWLIENTNLRRENINLFGQEKNDITYSVCKSDFLITDEEPDNIKYGSSLTNDQHSDGNRKFDFMITNPPYGETWKGEKKEITNESNEYGGRFSGGLPRVSDGSLLFLQHMISKMETEGSRIGVVFNSAPLFNGDAGSGESEIRKWIIENDLFETIIALPNQLFFNTGISTFIWVITNKKSSKRKGKVQLINGVNFFEQMKKSLGDKRKYISENNRSDIIKIYNEFKENRNSIIVENDFFSYTRITVHQPKIENGEVLRNNKGYPKPDLKLKIYERVPFTEDIEEHFSREVEPHLPNSWVDFDKSVIGYEINFRKYFYEFKAHRSSLDISKDLLDLKNESDNLLNEIIY